MTNNLKTNAIIRLMVERIVSAVNPLKIILFGSFARNTAGPDSDVDLMVVLPIVMSMRRVTVQLYRLLSGMGLAKDIVVSPQEIEKFKDMPGTLVRPALLEGKVLYDRAV